MIKSNFLIPIYAIGHGTANDFPTYFKTNCSIRRAVRTISDNRQSKRILDIDTLLVNNDTYAINVAGGGAFTNGVTRYSKRAKRFFGKLAYLAHGAREACKMRPQTVKFTVDEKEYLHDIYFFLILNTSHAGSIKNISPHANPNDEQLNLVALKKCGFFARLSAGVSIFLRRAHKNKNLLHLPGKSFHVEIVKPPTESINKNFTSTDIDGNAGAGYPLLVKVSERKIQILSRRK